MADSLKRIASFLAEFANSQRIAEFLKYKNDYYEQVITS